MLGIILKTFQMRKSWLLPRFRHRPMSQVENIYRFQPRNRSLWRWFSANIGRNPPMFMVTNWLLTLNLRRSNVRFYFAKFIIASPRSRRRYCPTINLPLFQGGIFQENVFSTFSPVVCTESYHYNTKYYKRTLAITKKQVFKMTKPFKV